MGFLSKIWNSDNDRRMNTVKKNVALTMLLKGASILASFLLVPITIDYLNDVRYGIWLTLSSVLSCIIYFDIGLGNGLKNKLTDAIARNDKKSALIYVSTTYALIGCIALLFILLLFFCGEIFDYARLLNVPDEYRGEVKSVVLIAGLFFGLNFVLRLICTILHAFQRVAMSDLLNSLGNVISLIFIFILTKIDSDPTLLWVSIIFSLTPALVFLFGSIYLFMFPYKDLRPRWSQIDFSYSKSLLGLGAKFFFIQLSCVIIFQFSPVLINTIFGAKEVTSYSIANKYFNMVIMLFQIVLAPLWVAYSDAYARGDMEWIKRTTRKNLKFGALLAVGIGVMVAVSPIFYYLWIQDKVEVPFSVTVACAVYALVYVWYNIFITVINGIGTVKLQMYYTFFSTAVSIPLAVGLAHLWGVSGVVWGLTFALLPHVILAPLQYYKLVYTDAQGIWRK